MSIVDNILNTQVFFAGRVIDNNDPMLLGRIRALPETDNAQELEKSSKDFNENSITPDENGPWSPKDPFLVLPMLPIFINPVPEIGEYVHLFYQYRSTRTSKNKFYIPGPFSTPVNLKYENIEKAKTDLDAGVRTKRPVNNIKQNLSTEAAQRLFESRKGLGQYDGRRNAEFINDKTKGVFPEPKDNSLLGRGSADVIVKENHVLIRAGKYKPFNPPTQPDANGDRAFLQLSKFDFTKTLGTKNKRQRLVKDDTFLKYLIEYNIYNPENTQDSFRGDVTLYKLPSQVPQTNTANFDIDTVIDSTISVSSVIAQFDSKTKDEVVTFVNDFLTEFMTGELSEFFDVNGALKNGEQYPFYFRPKRNLLAILNNVNLNSDLKSIENLGYITNKIKINDFDTTPGYSLVYNAKGDDSVPYSLVDDSFSPEIINNSDETTALLGAKKLYLLSNSVLGTGSGKSQINFSDFDIYGISQDTILNEIQPNTSSMVRGEELMELLNLIVKFLITHVHPYPGLPPVPVSQDGTSSSDILKSILEAQQKILNGNIRIN